MTLGRRAWVESMIARVEPRAAARRSLPDVGSAMIASILDGFVDEWRRELAGEPSRASLPPPSPAGPAGSIAPPTQLSMFEIPA